MQVIGLVLVDGIVVTLGHGQAWPWSRENTCDDWDAFRSTGMRSSGTRKTLVHKNVGIHPVDARSKLAAATLDWKRIL